MAPFVQGSPHRGHVRLIVRRLSELRGPRDDRQASQSARNRSVERGELGTGRSGAFQSPPGGLSRSCFPRRAAPCPLPRGIPLPAARRRSVDSERDLCPSKTVGLSQPSDFGQDLDRDPRRPTDCLPRPSLPDARFPVPRPEVAEPVLGADPSQVRLELGDPGQDGSCEPADWGRRVDRLIRADHPHPVRFCQVEEFEDTPGRSTQSVELRHEDHVGGPGLDELTDAVELWPFHRTASHTGVDEDSIFGKFETELASEGFETRDLRLDGLVSGRYAGVNRGPVHLLCPPESEPWQ